VEESLPLADLKRIVESMAAAAREAGVWVVTGDTKVVEKGKGDGAFITTTTGVGVAPMARHRWPRPSAAGVSSTGWWAKPCRAFVERA